MREGLRLRLVCFALTASRIQGANEIRAEPQSTWPSQVDLLPSGAAEVRGTYLEPPAQAKWQD